jgi:DNA-binding transcriptional ArsR family regulator
LKPRRNTVDVERLRLRVRVIKALANPARLYLPEHLAEGETCVSELTETVGLDMSTVSRHLSILRQVGLVAAVKSGTYIRYALAGSNALRLIRQADHVCGCVQSGSSRKNGAEQ